MDRVAFKMKLLPGFANEYKRRHDELWPEIAKVLKDSGIQDYSIFLDEETNILFAALKVSNKEYLEKLAHLDIMKQ